MPTTLVRSVHVALAALTLLTSHAVAQSPAAGRRFTVESARQLLPWSEQIAVREQWLAQRHAALLPMMRRHGIAMWIVVNEEFHDDPVVHQIAPPRPYTGNRDLFVFVDAGAEGLRKFAVTGYTEENLARFFEAPSDEPLPPAATLRSLWARYQPQRIALGIGGGRGQTRTLTRDTYTLIAEAMGPDAEARFVSAAPLLTEVLDTRFPAELEYYRTAVAVTEEIVQRALSREVITPGVTTVGDVRRALYDLLWSAGVARGSSPTYACSARRARWRPRAASSRWPKRTSSSSPATSCTSTSASATWASIPIGRRWRTCCVPVRRMRLRG
jgi:hypothetical protein